MRRQRSIGSRSLRRMRIPIALPFGATSPDTSMTKGGSRASWSPTFSLGTAEPIDDNQVGALPHRGIQPFREFGESSGIETAPGAAGARIGYQANSFATRQHDDAEPGALRLATTAGLNDADRTKTRPAQVAGEVDEHAVGVIVRPIDDRSDIALSVEPHKAHLMERYI